MTSIIGARRWAFTLLETLVALAGMVTAMILVAQLAIWSLVEHHRNRTHQEALIQVSNVLEKAIAEPSPSLTEDWAKRQGLSEFLKERFPLASLTVVIEPQPGHRGVKRLIVTLEGMTETPVKLVGCFAPRDRKE